MFKKLLVIGGIIAAIAIIALVVVVVGQPHPETKSETTQNDNAGVTARPGWKLISDEHSGFSVQYPTDTFVKSTEQITLPLGNHTEKKDATVIKHEINIEHCALSGQCTPTTTNLKIGWVSVHGTIDEIKAQGLAEMVSIGLFGGQTVTTIEQGVEGEGITYYFVPALNGHTVMFFSTYMDENILGGYKDKPDFLTLSQQKAIFNEIASTFELSK